MGAGTIAEKVKHELAPIQFQLHTLAKTASQEQRKQVAEQFLVHIEGFTPEVAQGFVRYAYAARDVQATNAYAAVEQHYQAITPGKHDRASFWKKVHDIFPAHFSARDIALLMAVDGWIGPSYRWMNELAYDGPHIESACALFKEISYVK